MERRKFIKQTGTGIIAGAIFPSLSLGLSACSSEKEDTFQRHILRNFDQEQEECPNIIQDKTGQIWLLSLRRKSFPKETETISCFQLEKNWKEREDLLQIEGQFESLHAVAGPKNYPVLAWTKIEGDKWTINVSSFDGKSFSKPHQFTGLPGKSNDPVLHTDDSGIVWICWEQYLNGKLSIYFSRIQNGVWLSPMEIDLGSASCFNPSIASNGKGEVYIAYGKTAGLHQNIELATFNSQNLLLKDVVPVASGGVFTNRVNINCKPSIAFDPNNTLWISYESNRFNSRMKDGDNITGERACSIVRFKNGVLESPSDENKWLFQSINDHKPTFYKAHNGSLHLLTHCGGDYAESPYWQYRISSLSDEGNWSEPISILNTEQKGDLINPSCVIHNDELILASSQLQFFKHEETEAFVRSQLLQLETYHMRYQSELRSEPVRFETHQAQEHEPDLANMASLSGRARQTPKTKEINGETYQLIFGNLHEHSNISVCWPAGTDGTLHDDYRFALFSEGYHFQGITDHSKTIAEVYWRKSLRLADFYNSPGNFIAVPAMEWTLPNTRHYEGIAPGVGHYNIIFKNLEEAKKLIRNNREVYSAISPESNDSARLWELLHKLDVDCLTIPHHVSDIEHPCDWEVHDSRYVKIVEVFQCRGNSEYPGCPRERNLLRHFPSPHKQTYTNYALKEKGYKLGFIASGDHNAMGIGLAGLWVKEISREGIFEALNERRCIATTGDPIMIEISEALSSDSLDFEVSQLNLNIKIEANSQLCELDILRNSEIIDTIEITDGSTSFSTNITLENNIAGYYYARITLLNDQIAWSNLIWKTN